MRVQSASEDPSTGGLGSRGISAAAEQLQEGFEGLRAQVRGEFEQLRARFEKVPAEEAPKPKPRKRKKKS